MSTKRWFVLALVSTLLGCGGDDDDVAGDGDADGDADHEHGTGTVSGHIHSI